MDVVEVVPTFAERSRVLGPMHTIAHRGGVDLEGVLKDDGTPYSESYIRRNQAGTITKCLVQTFADGTPWG